METFWEQEQSFSGDVPRTRTHPELSKDPQNSAMTSFSIFQRKSVTLSSILMQKWLQKLLLFKYFFCRLINRLWLHTLQKMSVPTLRYPVCKLSPLLWLHLLPPLRSLADSSPAIWCWSSQCRWRWQGGDFPPLSLSVCVCVCSVCVYLPSTPVSMVKDLDTSWKTHFQ